MDLKEEEDEAKKWMEKKGRRREGPPIRNRLEKDKENKLSSPCKSSLI